MANIYADVHTLWTTKAAFPTLSPGSKYKTMGYDNTLKVRMMKDDNSDTIAAEWSADVHQVLLAGAQTISGAKTFSSVITSTVVTGTAPLAVASITVVANLNADLLDGNHASAFATSAHLHDGDTLQCDSINSNGGAFLFTTTSTVGFNQQVTIVKSSDSLLSTLALDNSDTGGTANGNQLILTADGSNLFLRTYGDSHATLANKNIIGTNSSGMSLGFMTSNTERVIISSTGAVSVTEDVTISKSIDTELIALKLQNSNTGTGAYVRQSFIANGAQAYISLYGATYSDSDYQEALIIQTDSATAGGMKIGTGGPEALVFFTSGIIHPRLTIASDGDVTMAKSLIMPAQADAGEGFIDFTASDASPESPTNQFMMLITPTSIDTDYYTLSSGTDGQIVLFKNAGSVAARVKNIYNEASSINYTIFSSKEAAILYYDDSFGYWRIFGDA